MGHSFGTHILGWGIYRLGHEQPLFLHTVILAGSVLKVGFPWQTLLGRKVRRLVNDCGTKDIILVLSQFAVLFTGMAGWLGFTGGTGRNFRNRFFDWGHSGYFLRGGLPDDSFMEQYWLPLLLTEHDAELVDSRSSSALNGLMTTLINNAEPIKLAVYMTPFVALTLWILGLYESALWNRAGLLASLAEVQTSAGRAPLGGTLALEALRSVPFGRSGGQEMPKIEAALYDAYWTTREIRSFQKHRDTVVDVAVSPDGTLAATASVDHDAGIWSIETGRTLFLVHHDDEVRSVDFEPDGRELLTGSWDGTARLWDTTSGAQLSRIAAGQGAIIAARFSPDGSKLFTLPESGFLQIWDASGCRPDGCSLLGEWQLPGKAQMAQFSPDGRVLGVATTVATVLWDLSQKQPKQLFANQKAWTIVLRFSPDGRLVGTGEIGGKLHI